MSATENIPSRQIVEPDQGVWGFSLQPLGCPKCRQVHLVEAQKQPPLCPNCGAAKLEPQPALLRSEPPEKILPFKKTRGDLGSIYKSFVDGVWLACEDFTVESLMQRAVPVFLPMWLVDSDVKGQWQAEAGFDYQVKSSQEAFSSGEWRSRDVIETRVRWEPRLGTLQRHYDNISSPAMSEHTRLLKQTGEFDHAEAQPYSSEQVRGALLRVPDVPGETAWQLAQVQVNHSAAEEVSRACAAQHFRNFEMKAEYTGLNWTQYLLPVYFSSYTADDGQPQVVIVNGQNGTAKGPRLASQRKGWRGAGISTALAVGLFILAMVFFALAAIVPPLGILAIFLIVAAFVGLVVAIIMAVYPSQWNRQQKP